MTSFDLDATEYEFKENGGDQKIIIRRTGNLGVAVDVAFKVADFLSSYGEDYVVLDPTGKTLDKVEGVKPDVSELVAEESDAGIIETPRELAEPVEAPEELAEPVEAPADDTEEAVETAEPVEAPAEEAEAVEASTDETEPAAEATEEAVDEAEPVEEAEPADDTAEQVVTDDISNEPAMAALDDAEPVEELAEPVEAPDDDAEPVEVAEPVEDTETATLSGDTKKAYSTGSPLRDAAYAYLDIDGEQVELQSAEVEQEKREIEQILTETNAYFQTAEGAEGIAHFDKGETEKAVTIRPSDNDEPSGTRLILFALMGVREGQRGLIAPDANTYVSLIDDEEREMPRYELVKKNITLTEENPEAVVTVRRTAGLKDFTTAYLSTVEPTTNAAPKYEYQQFNGRAVQFLPGETEKQITVKALYFDKSGKFGLRLEAAEENALFGNYAMDVTIKATETEAELQAVPDEPEPQAELQSAAYVAQASDVHDDNPQAELKSGWDDAELFAAEKTLPSLGYNGSANDSISVGKGEISLFKITPSASGYFTFWATNEGRPDTYGYLYDASKNTLAYDDDSAGGLNFRINYNLTAGTTYYLGVKFYSSSKEGTISISVQAPTVTQGPIGSQRNSPYGMKYNEIWPSEWSASKSGSDSDNYA